MIHLYIKTQDGDFVYEKEVKCENCKHWDKTDGLVFPHGKCSAITMVSDDAYLFGTTMEDPEFLTNKDFGCALFTQSEQKQS